MSRYREAGVDLEAQVRAHRAAQAIIGKRRHAYTSSIEVAMHTDGVGTKAQLALDVGRPRWSGWTAPWIASRHLLDVPISDV